MEKKERVAVKDIFPGNWDYACIHVRVYANEDAPSVEYFGLSSGGDDLRVLPENIRIGDVSQDGLLLVTRHSQNNIFSYVAEFHKYPARIASLGGDASERSGQPCV